MGIHIENSSFDELGALHIAYEEGCEALSSRQPYEAKKHETSYSL